MVEVGLWDGAIVSEHCGKFPAPPNSMLCSNMKCRSLGHIIDDLLPFCTRIPVSVTEVTPISSYRSV